MHLRWLVGLDLLGLSLEEALVQSLKNSNKIASSRDSWIAEESVFSSNATKESSLKYSGSGSLSETDSGSGYTGSDPTPIRLLSQKIFLTVDNLLRVVN